MALQLLLEEKESAGQILHTRYKNNEQLFQQKKQEFDCTINKRQRLIEQVENS